MCGLGGKWEGRAEQTNPLPSLVVNQSFKCELIWGMRKTDQHLVCLTVGFCHVQILYVCGNWSPSAWEGLE